MKNRILYLSCLLISFLVCISLFSCTSDSGESGKIVLSKGESPKVTMAANMPSGSVNFNAASAWSAYTSTQSRSTDEVGWIHLDITRGEAGACSLTFTLDRNDTGLNRTGYIVIVCEDEKLVITVTQTTEIDPDAPKLDVAFKWEIQEIQGFTATFVSEIPEGIWGEDEHNVFISEYPFSKDEVLSGDGYTSSFIKTAKVFWDARDYCVITGLQPQHTYYVMQTYRAEEGANYYSNLLKIETPEESWFTKICETRMPMKTMKDAEIDVYLSPYMEAEWNNYKIECGYEIESKGKQMSATYRKVSPEFEEWEDTDSPLSGIKMTSEDLFTIELHNLQPGETVKVTPWISVNGTRHESDGIEVKTYEIATTGYVEIGCYKFAACNVGASQPYEVGTMYNDPNDVVVEDGAVVPTYLDVESMAYKTLKVCGTLEGKDGMFIMDGENTVFLPFNKLYELVYQSGYYQSGYYWIGEKIHPVGSGAGFMAQLYFFCTDEPGIFPKMIYGTNYWTVPGGTQEMSVRLRKL